jgi:hypothetical protein
MNLSMSTEQLQALVAKTIFEAIPEAKRIELLTNAIKSVLVPPDRKGGVYDKTETALEEIFRRAVEKIAYDEVQAAMAEGTPLRAQVTDAIKLAVTKAVESIYNDPKTIERMAAAITRPY